jgi:hypothetical protein
VQGYYARYNLTEEVRSTLLGRSGGVQNEADLAVWKRILTDDTVVISEAKKPKMVASYDMAWHHIGSGHWHDSQSGH